MFTQGAGPEHIPNPDFAPFCKNKRNHFVKIKTPHTPSSFTVAAMLDRANEQGPTLLLFYNVIKPEVRKQLACPRTRSRGLDILVSSRVFYNYYSFFQSSIFPVPAVGNGTEWAPSPVGPQPAPLHERLHISCQPLHIVPRWVYSSPRDSPGTPLPFIILFYCLIAYA